ncbi:MerR family transcriptional regulator [Corynebacterium sp. CCM 9203]|uniref:MerR family transcriptional regulator n=1 Tax=Corynebacterium sp. CCM 9203 TaxID=3057615 RepID=UPI003525410D
MTMTLTIRDLAVFAEVTTRTIRHYHDIGLMPPAGRDGSGQRIYVPEDAVRLVRIRNLIEAGFSLNDILDVLPPGAWDIDGDVYRSLRQRVDRRLDAEEKTVRARRARLRELADPDRIGLPTEAIEILGEWRRIGIREELIAATRATWTVCAVVFPGRFRERLRHGAGDLDYPEYRHLLTDISELWDTDPDDPAVEHTARRLAAYLRATYGPDKEQFVTPDSAVVDSVIEFYPPALVRFNELVYRLYVDDAGQ